MKRSIFFLCLTILMLACSTSPSRTELASNTLDESCSLQKTPDPCIEFTVEVERDNIFMMLAYAIVYKDWQNDDMRNNRGYNIGCVMTDKNDNIVYWGRNCVNIVNSGTQHGEVRLIYYYLQNNSDIKNLADGYTIYTTLEPCAMCAGMMVLNRLPRTVWGQADCICQHNVGFGDAVERLAFNSTALPGGYPPYPRTYPQDPEGLISDGSCVSFRRDLDGTYQNYCNTESNPSITEFLAGEEARNIYMQATDTFFNYTVTYEENKPYLEQALEYYEFVPDHYEDRRCLHIDTAEKIFNELE